VAEQVMADQEFLKQMVRLFLGDQVEVLQELILLAWLQHNLELIHVQI
jgi:hypothetical protein